MSSRELVELSRIDVTGLRSCSNINMILDKPFFNRPADVVARELIGCNLCLKDSDSKQIQKLTIHETEAYMGSHDLACHASKGKTKRTEVLYQEAGTIYVYLIYGMHSMLNVVTGKKEYPAAVLIRGVRAWNGPGKLTKALGITREFNGCSLGTAAGMWIEKPSSVVVDKKHIHATPRIGVAYAGEWARKELRFVLKDSQEIHI